MKKLLLFVPIFIASVIGNASCSLDYSGLGEAPAGMEGLWEKARSDEGKSREIVENVRRGLWQECSGSTPAGKADVVSWAGCWRIYGGWEVLSDTANAYWPSGYTMSSINGGANIANTVVKSSNGRFTMVRHFGGINYDATYGYQQTCAKNGSGTTGYITFGPRSIYFIEDAIGGGAPVDPCTGN